MSWKPPSLRTKCLRLTALTSKPSPIIKNSNLPGHEMPGLPSNWTIFLRGSEEPIGSIGFIRLERACLLGEIGFILKHNYRRRGYMSEACIAVIDFGFRSMGLLTVEARSLPGNHPSIHLLEKVGMRRGKRVQARLTSKGALVDLDVYSIQAPRKAAYL